MAFDSGRRRAILAALSLLALGAVGAAKPDRTLEGEPLIDFDSLVRPDSPNHWLVAPATEAHLAPNAIAPVYDLSAARLAEAWRDVLERQPRTRLTAMADDGLQIEAEQRSALFGFVDAISVRVLALGPERSTFVAYSRSRVGYWDFGVNRRRLNDWIAALGEAVGRRTVP